MHGRAVYFTPCAIFLILTCVAVGLAEEGGCQVSILDQPRHGDGSVTRVALVAWLDEGEEVLKPVEEGSGPVVPHADITRPETDTTRDEPPPADLGVTWAGEEQFRAAGVLQINVTPSWSAYSLSSGKTLNGGNIGVDLSLPLNRFTDSRNLIAHVGADASFVPGGTAAGYTFDFCKLADLDGVGFYDSLVWGVATDVFVSNDQFAQDLCLTQVRGAIGVAVSDFVDIGVIGVWPVQGDQTTEDEVLFAAPPVFARIFRTEQPYDTARQVQLYLSTTLTANLETVFYVGHRDRPDGVVLGADLAWTVRRGAAAVGGIAADDHGAVAAFLGMQFNWGSDRFQESRLRGFRHRLTRGGMFSTFKPQEWMFSLDSLAAPITSEFDVSPWP